MEEKTKFCKHCGEIIDWECVVCPKCGKQVETLETNRGNNESIIINNTSSSSASAAAAASVKNDRNTKQLPWYLTWSSIFWLGIVTGGFYWVIGFILRVNWLSKN